MRDKIQARPAVKAAAARRPCRSRAAFTLVEVLMVILIVSMLIALLLPAINAAKVSAIKASIKVEVNELATALNAFKVRYGSYPPDRNWTRDEIAEFLRRAFPKYIPSGTQFQARITELKKLTEAESLVLWLGGRWDGTHLVGFHADPRANPFSFGTQRTTPFMQFAETRLIDRDGANNGYPEYFPPHVNLGQAVPYVCFSSRPNGKYWRVEDDNGNPIAPTLPQYRPFDASFMPGATVAVPYHLKTVDDPAQGRSDWVKPKEFQIICAGIDNSYGTKVQNKVFPSGEGYETDDRDNIISFTEKTLGES